MPLTKQDTESDVPRYPSKSIRAELPPPRAKRRAQKSRRQPETAHLGEPSRGMDVPCAFPHPNPSTFLPTQARPEMVTLASACSWAREPSSALHHMPQFPTQNTRPWPLSPLKNRLPWGSPGAGGKASAHPQNMRPTATRVAPSWGTHIPPCLNCPHPGVIHPKAEGADGRQSRRSKNAG